MPRVEKIDGGRVYIRPLDREVTVGDQLDVDGDMADYLVEERGDFEVVNTETDAEDTGEGSEDEVESWENWTEDDWLELDYKARADDVREGRVDDHLDAIVDVESSDTVKDAVEERRAELED